MAIDVPPRIDSAAARGARCRRDSRVPAAVCDSSKTTMEMPFYRAFLVAGTTRRAGSSGVPGWPLRTSPATSRGRPMHRAPLEPCSHPRWACARERGAVAASARRGRHARRRCPWPARHAPPDHAERRAAPRNAPASAASSSIGNQAQRGGAGGRLPHTVERRGYHLLQRQDHARVDHDGQHPPRSVTSAWRRNTPKSRAATPRDRTGPPASAVPAACSGRRAR